MSSYFGGSKVTAPIRKLEAKDWGDLVSRYINVPCPIPLDRAAFFALPKKGPGGRDELKDGPYLCAVTFKEGESHRCDANATSLVLVCIDLDDSDLARPFVEHPEALMDATWAPDKSLNFAAWLTANSTPENPRLRICFEIEVQTFDTVLEGQAILTKFVRFIGSGLIGLPKVWSGFRETRVLSQPAYRPTVFSDDPKDYSPVIASRTNGRAIQLLDVPQEVDEEIRASFAYHGDSGADDGDLAHLPVRGLVVEDIREPLFKIDPDCDYLTWTRVLTGLRHQFRREDEAEEAFHLTDDWCRSGAKYNDGDTESKWRSFRPDAPGKTPVTIATVFRLAMDAGWKNTRLANKLAAGFKEWLLTVEDATELMEEGPRQIAAQPFKNGVTDNAMMSALQARIKVLGSKVSATALVREIQKARTVQKREADSGNLPGWLRPWAYVKTIDKWYHILTGIELSPEAFNRTYMIELMPEDEVTSGARPSIMPGDFALNLKGRFVRKVDGVVYDPRWQGEEPFFEQDGKTYVNSYLTSSLPALDEKNSANAGKIYVRHLKEIIREEEYVATLLDWSAFIVQNPGKKCRWAPVIQGAQGCGKSIILNILGAAIGKCNVKLSNPGSTKSDFNDWAAGAQVVGIEEIRVKGMNKSEIMDKLKDVLANDQVALNRKNRDVATIDNVTNFIAFTNYHDALHLADDDRRYFVVKCRIQSRAQKEALAAKKLGGVPYFQCLAKLMTMGGALRHYLMNHEISPGFDPDGPAPDTTYRRQMIEESKGALQLAIEDMVRSGEFPMIGKDLILYEDLAARTRALAKHWEKQSDFLYSLGYEPFNGSQRFQVNGSRSQVWVHAEYYDEDFLGDPVTELKRRHDLISDESI